jgi:hypothetical protein
VDGLSAKKKLLHLEGVDLSLLYNSFCIRVMRKDLPVAGKES